MGMKSNFSSQEWQLIKDGAEWVFAALAAADGNVAVTLKMKESKAFKKAVEDYRSRSDLMAEVLGDTSKPAKGIKGATLSEAQEAIANISKILDAKADAKGAAEYRRFLLSIAGEVAGATGEKALGLGEKFSKKEQDAMSKIKSALKPSKKAAKPAVSKPVAKKVAPKKPAARPAPRATRTSDMGIEPAKKTKVIATHKVEGNQTLSHLALKYYKNATRPYWKLIHEFNKDVIGDDEKNIWAGLELQIPELPDELKD